MDFVYPATPWWLIFLPTMTRFVSRSIVHVRARLCESMCFNLNGCIVWVWNRLSILIGTLFDCDLVVCSAPKYMNATCSCLDSFDASRPHLFHPSLTDSGCLPSVNSTSRCAVLDGGATAYRRPYLASGQPSTSTCSGTSVPQSFGNFLDPRLGSASDRGHSEHSELHSQCPIVLVGTCSQPLVLTPGTLPIINACLAVPAPTWTPPALAVLLTSLTGHSFALSSVGTRGFSL